MHALQLCPHTHTHTYTCIEFMHINRKAVSFMLATACNAPETALFVLLYFILLSISFSSFLFFFAIFILFCCLLFAVFRALLCMRFRKNWTDWCVTTSGDCVVLDVAMSPISRHFFICPYKHTSMYVYICYHMYVYVIFCQCVCVCVSKWAFVCNFFPQKRPHALVSL